MSRLSTWLFKAKGKVLGMSARAIGVPVTELLE
jgi:hypothetical protein